MSDARRIAGLFIEVASKLHLSVAIALTDCKTYPSSAIGRLESLKLLVEVLRNEPLRLALDREHRDTCLVLAKHACMLSKKNGESCKLGAFLDDGTAWRVFLNHLETQGSSAEQLYLTLEAYENRKRVEVLASGDGYWIPPKLHALKSWLNPTVA